MQGYSDDNSSSSGRGFARMSKQQRQEAGRKGGLASRKNRRNQNKDQNMAVNSSNLSSSWEDTDLGE